MSTSKLTKHERERRILTPAEKESLNRQIQNHEEDSKAGGPGYYVPKDRQDSPEEAATIARAKRTLARGEVGPMSRGEKIQVEKRAEQLQGYLTSKMLSKAEMALKPGTGPSFRKVVNEHSRVEMSPEFQKAATEWKNCRRRMDPHDPGVGNLEHIRPDKR